MQRNAQDLAPQVVRVGGRFLCVPGCSSGPLIDGCIAYAVRIRIVARGEIQIAVGVEGDGAARMTALVPLHGHVQNHLFRVQVERVSLHAVAGKHVFRIISGRGEEKVYPAVFRKVRIGGDADQAVLGDIAVQVHWC